MNDPTSAEATYRPPAFKLLKSARDVFDLKPPAPVLWRDPQTPGRKYGNACGLRVKAAGAVLVSYEDSPARIGARLHWFTKTPPDAVAPMGNPGAAVSDGP